jgi:hypothetical protein
VRNAFRRYFRAMQEQFSDFGTLELHVDDTAGSDNGAGAERQFGYCRDPRGTGPYVIAFAPKTEQLAKSNIDGLMAHEFGHALDFRYGRRQLESIFGRRLPDGMERRADAIATAAFGHQIKYDRKLVQCVRCHGIQTRPRRLGP